MVVNSWLLARLEQQFQNFGFHVPVKLQMNNWRTNKEFPTYYFAKRIVTDRQKTYTNANCSHHYSNTKFNEAHHPGIFFPKEKNVGNFAQMFLKCIY